MTKSELATAATSTSHASSHASSGSFVSLVPDNLAAFALRSLSARAATRTLDLQYYMWDEDVTGRLLIRDVLAAADRGVQVRLLLDDLYVRRDEHALAALSEHPAIEVRLFNPFHLRTWGWAGGAVEFLYASYRLNHRMHNKAWIVDGHLVIGGGRNIGDSYFDASREFNFRDLDLAVSGEAASGAVAVFERYWATRQARPIEVVDAVRPTDGGLDALRESLESQASALPAVDYLKRIPASSTLDALLAARPIPLAADRVRFVADRPGKGIERRRAAIMLNAVHGALAAARRDVVLISPYFVPGRRGTRLLVKLARRGVRVAVLTNSLAATDVLAVHGGYARYRKRLLEAGIRLHELKRAGEDNSSLFGSVGASLHTKAFATDGEMSFVGSFNLDPRSAYLNTEMGAFVQDSELAGQVAQEFDRLIDPARSWAVSLTDGRLTWTDEVAGIPRAVHHEPGASRARRVVARILGWLPIEPLL